MDKINLLITGGSGTLGKEIIGLINLNKYNLYAPTSRELDITNYMSVQESFAMFKPNIVIHSAAYVNNKESEIKYLKSINTNIIGTCNIINACSIYDAKINFISSDYVFDGEKGSYDTTDLINPKTNYAKSKAAGEFATQMYPKSLVIRTSFYAYSFPYEFAFEDQWSSKDYVDKIAPKILDLCLSNKTGIVHCGNKRRTIYEIALETKKDVKKSKRDSVKYYIPKDTSFKE
jgi:dTDP-4-dehydrorhamnose reductase